MRLHELQALLEREHVVPIRMSTASHSVRQAIQKGDLIAILPAIYADAAVAGDPLTRIRALHLRSPGAIITGLAAAAMLWDPMLAIETITASGRLRSSHRGFNVARRRIDPDFVTRIGDIPCTNAALTAVDLIPVRGADLVDRVLRDAGADGAAALEQMWLAHRAHRRQPGHALREAVLRESRDLPWSELERQAHSDLRQAGITGWVTNHPVVLGGQLLCTVVEVRPMRVRPANGHPHSQPTAGAHGFRGKPHHAGLQTPTRENTMTDNDTYVAAVHDRGLRFDLGTLSRRSALGLFGAAGVLGLASCASGAGTTGGPTGSTTTGAGPAATTTAAATSSATAASTAACVPEVPDETAGPFPGNDALTTSGVVRNDIRSSFAGATGVAAGIPLTLRLTVLNLADACKPMAGAAVYVWHCDREGGYSMYSSTIRHENYLRGVAATDANGVVEFTSIFPGCYAGRWPHIHFQVFDSIEAATSGGREIVKTSQLAFPEDSCQSSYAAEGYDTSMRNLSRTSLESDGVFRDDGAARQMATMSGDTTHWTAALTVAVN